MMPCGASKETIVALATPAGESAIAMVRLSGPLCMPLAMAIFGRSQEPRLRHAYFGRYQSCEGTVLDEVVYTVYGPKASYTGEAMLEIMCHGNPLIAQAILVDCISRGARMAEPGEFTRTAFLNNKMDLSQAEAVADMIAAKSYAALDIAKRQLGGELSAYIGARVADLVGIIAMVEAYIDFPEEDLPSEDTAGPVQSLQGLIALCEQLLGTYRYKAILNAGVSVVIVGAPNAGKSSLLNALVGHERAIVSHTAGTTRDFIVERQMLGGVVLQLMDTAGLRETSDVIEQQGIAKTYQKLQEADLCLWVVDVSTKAPTLSKGILDMLTPQNTLLIETKIDLERLVSADGLFEGFQRMGVSLVTGEGVEALKQNLVRIIQERQLLPTKDRLVINARHAAALEATIVSLRQALGFLKNRAPSELAVSELRLALEAISGIHGKVDNEQVLDAVFGMFCIGK